jgi:hypothetical protein
LIDLGEIMTTTKDLDRFYYLLNELENRIGGTRTLKTADGRMDWPQRGVYFFFDPGETRSISGERFVRVGTHFLKAKAKSTILNRQSQHRGVTRSGAGNHRGSIFRLIVGVSIIHREGLDIPSWGVAPDLGNASRRLGVDRETLKEAEQPLEIRVSDHIRSMPFLWLDIGDEPGPESMRGYIERNSIALLSNMSVNSIDRPSPDWLGQYCDRTKVRGSGMWNNNHVDEQYDPIFLDTLKSFVYAAK